MISISFPFRNFSIEHDGTWWSVRDNRHGEVIESGVGDIQDGINYVLRHFPDSDVMLLQVQNDRLRKENVVLTKLIRKLTGE